MPVRVEGVGDAGQIGLEQLVMERIVEALHASAGLVVGNGWMDGCM